MRATSLIAYLLFLAGTLAGAQPLLLVHYMPWYETPDVRGRWGYHWTGPDNRHDPAKLDDKNLPDLYSHYHPLIGPYDSTDPDVLECHLLQMKLAGIDGVIVDWYGISGAADYPPVHQASQAMFAASGRFGLVFAACFEDRTIAQQELGPPEAASQLAATYRWLDTHWFPSPHYLKHDGRPLLLNFGPVHLVDPAPWAAARASLPAPPALFQLHHLWKNAGADGGFAWVHAGPWDASGNPQEHLREIFANISPDPRQVIPSAFPGYRDIYEKSLLSLAHRDGKTLRESLDVALGGPWPVVQLITWNDYGEGTMIEPTHEFGYTFLEIVQAARNKLDPADLRLPARLLQLRRNPSLPAAKLDEISNLLAQKKVQQARERLAVCRN